MLQTYPQDVEFRRMLKLELLIVMRALIEEDVNNANDAVFDNGSEAFSKNQNDMRVTSSIFEQLVALELGLLRLSTEGK
jgi:hypothetical protein